MTGDLTETLTAVLGAHELGNRWIPADDHECRLVCFDDQPCGCTQLLMICTAEGCDWTGRPDGTQGDAHRAHVAAVLTALVADQAHAAATEGGDR